MFGWIAITGQGQFDSSRHPFRAVPQTCLERFILRGYGHEISVDLATGEFSREKNHVFDPGIIAARAAAGTPLRLFYRQDAEMLVNVLTGEQTDRVVRAGVVGWESDRHRVYYRVDTSTFQATLHIEPLQGS